MIYTAMDEDSLVNLVRENSHLWDKNSPNYKDIAMKRRTWASIASAMGCSAENCEKKWGHLRDSYSRRKRKGKLQKSGSAGSERTKWSHIDALSFLDDVTDARPGISSIDDARIAQNDSA